ncbi:MAG: Ldh family oxidoreductase [Phycisphaerae bacterium]|nr:Ldh family oxidoreductase [Phycisphaerae bacterium]
MTRTLPDRVRTDQLIAFCTAALVEVGMEHGAAQAAVEVLVTTDQLGVFTHGVRNLRLYVRRLREGGLDASAAPRVVKEGPSWALVDGGSALAMLTGKLAMETAVEKAKKTGVAFVGARNSCHFGAAGVYALMAARRDAIGLSMSNDVPSMTAPGARSHILGTNPLAFAVPAGEEKPVLLDIAMSTVAGSKIYQAISQGKPIPNTWIVDGEGVPTTDGGVYPHAASLLPMAGHKGYGLALLIDILSALVTGAASRGEVVSWIFGDQTVPTGHGHAFISIDPGAIVPIEQFKQRMDAMIRDIRRQPKAKNSQRIFLPGEMEWEKFDEAQRLGIALPDDVAESLALLAKETGVVAEPYFGH